MDSLGLAARANVRPSSVAFCARICAYTVPNRTTQLRPIIVNIEFKCIYKHFIEIVFASSICLMDKKLFRKSFDHEENVKRN